MAMAAFQQRGKFTFCQKKKKKKGIQSNGIDYAWHSYSLPTYHLYYYLYTAAGQNVPQRPFPDPMASSDLAMNNPQQSDPQGMPHGGADKAFFNKSFQGPHPTRPDPYKKLPVTNVTNDVQEKNLQQYLHRDKVYQKSLEVQHRRHMQLAHSKKSQLEAASMEKKARHQGLNVFGPGYKGYGNSKFPVQHSILYPRDKRKHRRMTNYSL